ncbi:MAG: hypothetical protein ACHQX3_00500 [Nitrospirales bacterium]
MVQGWNDGSEDYNIIHRLKEAMRQILEISYAGHPDGREVRLETITRIAKQALEKS